jgi:hypothetical protein
MRKKPIVFLLVNSMLCSIIFSGCSNKVPGKEGSTNAVSSSSMTKSSNTEATSDKNKVSDPLQSKEKILDSMVLANKYFLEKYPSPAANADPTHTGNIWTKGTYLQGVMALYKTNNDSSLYKYAKDWATSFNWNARSGNRTTNADDQNCMQTYIDLYVHACISQTKCG